MSLTDLGNNNDGVTVESAEERAVFMDAGISNFPNLGATSTYMLLPFEALLTYLVGEAFESGALNMTCAMDIGDVEDLSLALLIHHYTMITDCDVNSLNKPAVPVHRY